MSGLELHSRYARMRSLGFAWFLNILIGVVIGSSWLRSSHAGGDALTVLYLAAALVSSIATLASIPALALWLVAWIAPDRRLIGWMQAAVWTVFQLMLFADTRMYALFRDHLNGMVWNLLTNEGGRNTLDLGLGTWVLVACGCAALFVLELFVWNRWLSRVRALETSDPNAPSALRAKRVWVAGCFAIVALVLLDKGIYAAADLGSDRRITVLSRLFPAYQRLTLKRMAHDVFGMKVEERTAVETPDESLLLRYPRAAPELAPTKPAPNILIVVVDSLRADMLAEETMPELMHFARGARRFEDHLSGGNSTRYGVFSLIYGIHGSYWQPVYEEHAPPVLVTALSGLGYDMKVLSSPTMNSPEFRSTAWVTIEADVEDDLPGEAKHEPDEELARRFERFLDERSGKDVQEPFFCFALLDATHASYGWPPEETRFEPFAEHVDFVAMSAAPEPDEIERVFNSYRNAVHFADGVVGRMLMSLRNHGHAHDTIVVVTGDHGEEFFENGYFGHTSNFTSEQVRVPFLLAGPGITPGVETRPTAHVDLVPTLLEQLGADPGARAGYTHGVDLLDPPRARARVVASWDEVAVWVDGGILRIPLELHKGLVEGYDHTWTRLSDEDGLIARQGAAVSRFALENSNFLR